MARKRKSKKRSKGKRRPQPAHRRPAPSSGESESPALTWFRKLAPIILGLLFVVAGGSKVLDPRSFITSLASYGVPEALRYPLAMVLPGVELVLGFVLLLRWQVRTAAAATAGLMVVFLVAIAWGWSSGTLEECGCFGPFLERTPGEAFAIDLVYLAMAIGLFVVSPATKFVTNTWRSGALAAMTLGAIALTMVAYNAGPGGLGATTTIGDAVVAGADLSTGEHLLYLFHHECPHCADNSPKVANYARDPDLPPVTGLTYNTAQVFIDRYAERYGFDFAIQSLAPRNFARITGDGSVPQLVWLRDGAIQRTWMGTLPESRELGDLLR